MEYKVEVNFKKGVEHWSLDVFFSPPADWTLSQIRASGIRQALAMEDLAPEAAELVESAHVHRLI